jgi:hypothetical protein
MMNGSVAAGKGGADMRKQHEPGAVDRNEAGKWLT